MNKLVLIPSIIYAACILITYAILLITAHDNKCDKDVKSAIFNDFWSFFFSLVGVAFAALMTLPWLYNHTTLGIYLLVVCLFIGGFLLHLSAMVRNVTRHKITINL